MSSEVVERIKGETVSVWKDPQEKRPLHRTHVLLERDDGRHTLVFSTSEWTGEDPGVLRQKYYERFHRTPEVSWREWCELRDHWEKVMRQSGSVETAGGVK